MTKSDDFQVYIVATPIGNKADLSFRAIEVLKSVDLIACEDSRTSAKLLAEYAIATKLVSYHKFNEKQRTKEFLSLLSQGKKIALISDAGTPCVSDPGRVLVQELFKMDVKITSIPGASAVTTFVSMIPRDTEEFAFVGFLPRNKSQQQKVFGKYIHTDLIFYESPLRLMETLENVKAVRGSECKVAVGRELTKMFEEVKVGSVDEIINYYSNNILKGEVVCALYASNGANGDDSCLVEYIRKLKNAGFSDKDISQILSILFEVNKNKIYKMSLVVE